MKSHEYVTPDVSFSVRSVQRMYTGADDSVEAWEAQRLVDGSSIFFQYLTDALLYAEGVTAIDELSPEARVFWNTVASS